MTTPQFYEAMFPTNTILWRRRTIRRLSRLKLGEIFHAQEPTQEADVRVIENIFSITSRMLETEPIARTGLIDVIYHEIQGYDIRSLRDRTLVNFLFCLARHPSMYQEHVKNVATQLGLSDRITNSQVTLQES